VRVETLNTEGEGEGEGEGIYTSLVKLKAHALYISFCCSSLLSERRRR
jgi:hypothetical protein